MLYKFVEGYTADYTAKNRCIALYTDTHCVTALHSYTATIQLHSAIHYTAIQRYTLYNLYNTPLASTLRSHRAAVLPIRFGGYHWLAASPQRSAHKVVLLHRDHHVRGEP
jgi:hypothetical protein